MMAHDDVEAFLQMFENTAVREGWESEGWAWLLAPLLTGEAQRAYFALSSAVSIQFKSICIALFTIQSLQSNFTEN